MFNRILNTPLHEIVLIKIILFEFYVVGCYVASDEYVNIKMLLLRPELKSYAGGQSRELAKKMKYQFFNPLTPGVH